MHKPKRNCECSYSFSHTSSNFTYTPETVSNCAENPPRAGSAATGRRAILVGGIVGNGLDRQKSASDVELRHGTLVTRPPSNSPGDYWTKRYLSQELHKLAFSSDEENHCHKGGSGRARGAMKAPFPASRLRSSLDDLRYDWQ